MALVQSLNIVFNTITLVNENKDTEAASNLGIKIKKSYSGSFLDKVTELSESKAHTGGLIVTPDSKSINLKELLSKEMDLSYTLTESISMLAANSISILSTLSEDISGSNALLDSNQMLNVRNTLTEGCVTVKDALINVFSNSTNLVKAIKKSFTDILGESSIYTNLITNAVIGANMLYNINKISSFTNDNIEYINESMNTSDVYNRADNILFSTLDLQENLAKTYIEMYKFDNGMSTMLENNDNILKDISDYISLAIDKVAKPIAENKIPLKSNILIESYNIAVESIAALYDQYIQDLAI